MLNPEDLCKVLSYNLMLQLSAKIEGCTVKAEEKSLILEKLQKAS